MPRKSSMKKRSGAKVKKPQGKAEWKLTFDRNQFSKQENEFVSAELAKWLSECMDIEITGDLPSHMQDGKLPCQIIEKLASISYNKKAKPGSFQARENINVSFRQACLDLGMTPEVILSSEQVEAGQLKPVLSCLLIIAGMLVQSSVAASLPALPEFLQSHVDAASKGQTAIKSTHEDELEKQHKATEEAERKRIDDEELQKQEQERLREENERRRSEEAETKRQEEEDRRKVQEEKLREQEDEAKLRREHEEAELRREEERVRKLEEARIQEESEAKKRAEREVQEEAEARASGQEALDRLERARALERKKAEAERDVETKRLREEEKAEQKRREEAQEDEANARSAALKAEQQREREERELREREAREERERQDKARIEKEQKKAEEEETGTKQKVEIEQTGSISLLVVREQEDSEEAEKKKKAKKAKKSKKKAKQAARRNRNEGRPLPAAPASMDEGEVEGDPHDQDYNIKFNVPDVHHEPAAVVSQDMEFRKPSGVIPYGGWLLCYYVCIVAFEASLVVWGLAEGRIFQIQDDKTRDNWVGAVHVAILAIMFIELAFTFKFYLVRAFLQRGCPRRSGIMLLVADCGSFCAATSWLALSFLEGPNLRKWPDGDALDNFNYLLGGLLLFVLLRFVLCLSVLIHRVCCRKSGPGKEDVDIAFVKQAKQDGNYNTLEEDGRLR